MLNVDNYVTDFKISSAMFASPPVCEVMYDVAPEMVFLSLIDYIFLSEQMKIKF